VSSFFICSLMYSNFLSFPTFSPDAGPTNSANGGSGDMMDSDIPQEVLDQIAADVVSHQRGVDGGSSGGSGTPSRIRVCPHCTFENGHRGTDCEVCGLPLA
jgi:nuclear protein localization family protein 4